MIFKIILIKLAIICYLKSIKTLPTPNTSLISFNDQRNDNFNQTDVKRNVKQIEKGKIKF
jgi:hypothetical protein